MRVSPRLVVLPLLLCAMSAQAVVHLDDHFTDNGDADYRTGEVQPTAAQIAQVRALKATAQWTRFGTVRTLVRHGQYLGTGYAGTPEQGARAWLRDNSALFRLTPASVDALELVNTGEMPHTDARAVLLRQRFNGLRPTVDGLITVGIVDGKIYYASSSSAGDQPLPGPAVLNPLDAWLIAAADLNRFIRLDDVLSQRDLTDTTGWHQMNVLGFSETQRVRLVAVPMPAGGVRQAWETIVLDNQYGIPLAFMHLVDAETGAILRRQNHVNHQTGGLPVPQPFQGSFANAEPQCAARHNFSVGEGMAALQAGLVSAVPSNAVALRLYFGEGESATLVASASPTLGGAELIQYAPGSGVPAGTYQLEACLGEAFINLPPYNYVGAFIASPVDLTGATTPVTGADANAPQWRWFPGVPSLDYGPTDIRKVTCFAPLPQGGLGGCDIDSSNVAARAPWDTLLGGLVPTFTTIGNAAITAGGSISPLTPSLPIFPISPDRKYDFAFNNAWTAEGTGSGCSPDGIVTSQIPNSNGNDLSAVTVNLFVAHNRMHDFAYHLGFTERNYNLQLNNFGLTPASQQNDPEVGTAQAGALAGHPSLPSFGTAPGRNNANQISLPDGVPGITNQYLFQPIGGVGYPPCADGSWDMGIVGHEYTHAISNRMVAGPDGNLSGAQAGAMGESWSDLVATEYLIANGFVPEDGNNPTALAGYTTGNLRAGIRNHPANNNPLNYSNVGYDTPGPQVHADGEIWTGTQWAVRQALVDKYEAEFPHADAVLQSECANGIRSPQACPGSRRWIQLVFDAWLLLGGEISMLDARDAMLAADLARFGGANQAEMWRAFAQRGMGELAYSDGTDDPTPLPSFESPLADDEAVISFEVKGATGALENARILVGRYATRSRHVADTDPLTTYDPALPIDTINAPINRDTAAFIPGVYDFIVIAPGHGIHTFPGVELKTGSSRISFTLPVNWASVTQGGSAITVATGAVEQVAGFINPNPPPITPEWLIDDTEDTGTLLGDGGNVIGSYAIVALGGGERTISSAHISTAAGPTNAGRWGAVRQFELRACSGACTDAEGDFTTFYTSAEDAFPGSDFRPQQQDMNLRRFTFDPVTATHIQLRTLHTQCSGHPRYQGDIDGDPLNNTDCMTARPLISGLNLALGGDVIGPAPGSYARATEIQLFEADASMQLTQQSTASSAQSRLQHRFGGALGLALLLPLLLAVRRRLY